MRPMYEDNNTLAAERKVIDFLCELWHMDAAKLPISYNVDYAMFKDGKLRAWMEVKCRYCASSQYDTYFISAKKIVNGIQLSETTGMPFVLAVQWEDKIGYMPVLKGSFDIRIGGRQDRHDWQDVEPMAHFRIQDFKMIDHAS